MRGIWSRVVRDRQVTAVRALPGAVCVTAVLVAGLLVSLPAAEAHLQRWPAITVVMPAELKARAVMLRWRPVRHAVHYRVLRDSRRLMTTTRHHRLRIRSPRRDGVHHYLVLAVNVRGRVLPTKRSIKVVVDHSAPLPVIDAWADPITNHAPRISWTRVKDIGPSGIRCYQVRRDGALLACVRAHSFTDSHARSGDHSYTVRARDAAGNLGPVLSDPVVVRVDRVAPDAPGLLPSASPTPDAPVLAWTPVTGDESGATTYLVYRDGKLAASTSDTSFVDSAVAPTQDAADVTYTYSVASTDSAGNVSALSSSNTVVTSRRHGQPNKLTAPVQLTAISPTAASPSLSWGTPSSGEIAIYRIYRDGQLVGTSTANTYVDASAGDGSYGYTVTAVGTNGNESAASNAVTVLYDTIAPSAPSVHAASPTAGAPVLAWSASTDAGSGVAQYAVSRDGAQIAVTTSLSFTEAGVVLDGPHLYSVQAVDAVGNVSTAGSASVLVDTSPPSGVAPLGAVSPTSVAPALSWSTSTDTGSGVLGYRISRNGTQIATTSALTYSDVGVPSDGSYTYSVTAIDGAGNSSASTSVVVVVDSVAPGVPGGVVAVSPTVVVPVVSWFGVSDAVSYQVARDGVVVGSVSGTSFTDSSVAGYGSYRYTVSAVDAAGNVSGWSAGVTVTYQSGGVVGYPSTLDGVHLAANMHMLNGARIPDLATAQQLARDYDWLVPTATQLNGYAKAMRATNPKLKMFVYQNGMFSPLSTLASSWYMLDKNGNRIQSVGWGNYLMDPRSTTAFTYQDALSGGKPVTYYGWTDWVKKRCQMTLNQAPGAYDGCFLDMLMSAPLNPNYNRSGTVPVKDQTSDATWTATEWMQMTGAVAQAVAAYTNQPIEGNALSNGISFYSTSNVRGPTKNLLPYINTAWAEITLRDPHAAATAWPSLTVWKQHIQMMIDAGTAGTPLITTTKLWTTATTQQQNQWRTFALASYLIGNTGSDYFEFSTNPTNPPLNDYNNLYTTNIGTPTETHTTTDGYLKNNLYQRTFTNGITIVNPTTTTITTQLPTTYLTQTGTPTTQITLPPNTATILTLT